MKSNARSISESAFARKWLGKGAYRRLKRDAKKAARKLRRKAGEGCARMTRGWL